MKKVFIALVLVILSISLVFYFFTLELFQQVEITRMQMSGVSNVMTKNFHYFEKNNCVDSKECQCVLLLHGLGDFALTWREMLSYPASSFAQGTHFFAPNLPGALSTPKLASTKDYNVQSLAKKVSDFFLQKCDSWIVVGNSYGAWMSVFISLQNEEKVKALLLLGPAGIKQDYSEVTNYYLSPSVEGAKSYYKKIYADPKEVPDFIFERVVDRVKDQVVLDQLKTVTESDFLENHLGKLKVPVQYVWGDKDGVIPLSWADTFLKLTPNSKLDVIKNCGHVPQKECTEGVLLTLNELLNRSK